MKKYLMTSVFCLLSISAFADAGSAIDNVQNYSSSPFYKTGGPYNQNPPAPVYVKGPSLGAAECELAASSAVWTQCSFRNNCTNVSLDEIRPGVIMELANRTDNSYIPSCVGYIDGAFNQFKQNASAAVYTTKFPGGGNPVNYGNQAAPQNPYSYENATPYWRQEQDDRQQQLQVMQQQNNPAPALAPEKMPETFSDIGFVDRMKIANEGWQNPSVGNSSYTQVYVESDEQALARELANADIAKQRTYNKWCIDHPDLCREEQYQKDIEKLKKELEIQKAVNSVIPRPFSSAFK